MPLVTTEAVILQGFDYSETSKILRLLTPSHGVQSVIAKGARRPKSRYGGVLEPFTEGTATFYRKENRELHTLGGFDLQRTHQRLGRDLVRFGAASLLAELVLRTASEEPAPAVFLHLRHAFSALDDAEPGAVETVALGQAWRLVVALGFGPSLEQCVSCGALLPDADLFFDYSAGGLLCGGCGGGAGGGRVLPAAARMDLARLCAGEPLSIRRTSAHWQLLGRFLGYHLVDAGSLRSLEFLLEAVDGT